MAAAVASEPLVVPHHSVRSCSGLLSLSPWQSAASGANLVGNKHVFGLTESGVAA